MRKRKSALFILNTGIFPASVMFCYNMRYDEIMSNLLKMDKRIRYWRAGLMEDKRFIEKDSWGVALKRIVTRHKNEEKTLFYIILKNEFRFKDYDYCCLAHEVLHICQFFLPDCLDRNREIEAEAYLHTHLMEQCLRAIRKAK